MMIAVKEFGLIIPGVIRRNKMAYIELYNKDGDGDDCSVNQTHEWSC